MAQTIEGVDFNALADLLEQNRNDLEEAEVWHQPWVNEIRSGYRWSTAINMINFLPADVRKPVQASLDALKGRIRESVKRALERRVKDDESWSQAYTAFVSEGKVDPALELIDAERQLALKMASGGKATRGFGLLGCRVTAEFISELEACRQR